MSLPYEKLIADELIIRMRHWLVVCVVTFYGMFLNYKFLTAKELEMATFYPIKFNKLVGGFFIETQLLNLALNVDFVVFDVIEKRRINLIFENLILSCIASALTIIFLFVLYGVSLLIKNKIVFVKKQLFILWGFLTIRVVSLIRINSLDKKVFFLLMTVGILLIEKNLISKYGHEIISNLFRTDSNLRGNIINKDTWFKNILLKLSIKRIRGIKSEVINIYTKSLVDITVMIIIYHNNSFCDLHLWVKSLILINVLISCVSYKIFSMDKDFMLIKDYYPITRMEFFRKFIIAVIIQFPYCIIVNEIIMMLYGNNNIYLIIYELILLIGINFIGILIDYFNMDTRSDIKDSDRGEMNRIILIVIVALLYIRMGVM